MKNCFICGIPYEKGIGICCSRQCHNKRINTRNRNNDKNVLEKIKRIEDYNSNPILCLHCKSPLTYNKFKDEQKFCSHHCSASVTNITRRDTLLKTIEGKSKSKYPCCKVTFKNCIICNKVFRSSRGKIKYCSTICKSTTSIKHYRRSCKFKISKTTNPELFDKQLLKEHGWYRASNHPKGYNPKGATWDHLFRIEDGYKLGIDPNIISHPANAQMISWEENFSRKKSAYEELLIRINNYKENPGPARYCPMSS